MELWSQGRLLKTYRVVIGRGGAGPKRMEGDGKTPEGKYHIDSRHVSAHYHRFLHVSYPNDADRRFFTRAQKEGKLPPDAKIGGDIGIHGERRGLTWLPHKWIDWTQGCIALDNDEIEEIYPVVKPQAEVEILP